MIPTSSQYWKHKLQPCLAVGIHSIVYLYSQVIICLQQLMGQVTNQPVHLQANLQTDLQTYGIIAKMESVLLDTNLKSVNILPMF